MKRIAVFASGSGSNAENLAKHFNFKDLAKVQLIISNSEDAGVIARAQNLNIKCVVFSNAEFKAGHPVLKLLSDEKIDFIVLAGFLLLVPGNILHTYKDRIVNIHPALLPLYGGKGFYGMKVHEKIIRSGEIISGITVHRVNEIYDDGEIIFQAACHVRRNETPESLAYKIHLLEYAYYPVVVEKLIKSLPK